MLQEVSTSEGDLLRPEFEGNVTASSMENARGCRLGLEVVEGGHGGQRGRLKSLGCNDIDY